MLAAEAVERALDVVADREDQVHAWAHLDPDRARDEARAVDRRPSGPLTGLTIGVKDIFDTADQPTAFGSPMYAGRRQWTDAGAVALVRSAGAVCLGKTATAEFAYASPGPTTNPHRGTHTPGGSSMGSAAAVASGMVDAALGTQTAASIIRPASYCGTYGFKPSFGTVPTAGVKAVSPSLDTVGWFARDPTLLELLWTCLTDRVPDGEPEHPPRVGVVRTEQWQFCDTDSERAVEEMAVRLRSSGATVGPVDLPGGLHGLADAHRVVMAYEAARSLAFEHRSHRADLSAVLCDLLDEGSDVDPLHYDSVIRRIQVGKRQIAEAFAGWDAFLTPAVTGEAPPGLASTGDPRFGRLWTMLGVPSVAVPSSSGSTGLPVGVQLVGPSGADGRLLAITKWLGRGDR